MLWNVPLTARQRSWLTYFSSIAIAMTVVNPALAQSTGLGGIISNVKSALTDAPTLVTAVSFLVGIIIVFSGLNDWRQHSQNPEQFPIGKAIQKVLIGGAMSSITLIVLASSDTLFGQGGGQLKYVPGPRITG